MQEIKFNYIILQVRNRAPGKQRDLFQSSWIVGYKVGTRVQDALHLMMCCAVLCLVTLSCPTLCNPMDCSPPGPSVHGDSPDKNTGVVAMPSSRGSSQPRDRTQVFHNAGRFFIIGATREALYRRMAVIKLKIAEISSLGSKYWMK